MRKLTTKEFIDKAIIVHKDAYDYTSSTYIGSKKPLEIHCNRCGNTFLQTPNDHLSKKAGCPTCAIATSQQKTRKSPNVFIEEATLTHSGKYTYTNTKYVNSHTKVTITCPTHGDFLQLPADHLRGCGCPACKVVAIKDSLTDSTKEFIDKAFMKHGNIYDYSKVNYINSTTNVEISCTKCGTTFWQPPSNHLQSTKGGCPECKKVTISINNSHNTWSYSGWEAAGKASDNFEGFSLYVIECSSKSTGERFIKVGKTYRAVNQRFNNSTAMPYKFKVLTQVYHNAYAISTLETQIKDKLKAFSFTPSKSFDGQYECFSIDAKELAISLAEE